MSRGLIAPKMWNAYRMAQQLVGSSKAAEAAGVSINTLLRYVREGYITPADRTLGGHYRWDLEELARQMTAFKAARDSK